MKTAVITGASCGIGAAIAKQLLADGWRVIGLCRTEPPVGVEHVPCDLRHLSAVEKAAKHIITDVIPQVDLAPPPVISEARSAIRDPQVPGQSPGRQECVIICAAGIGKFAGAESFSAQQIDELMRVNFTAHAVLLGALLPAMKKKRHGRIIAIGSEAALQGARQGSIYCASKFALRGYLQSLRLECRTAGIGVSLINPGLVRTDFHQEVHFQPAAGEQHALQVADVCQCVKLILALPAAAVAEEINLQPMQPQVEKKRTAHA